MGRVPDLPSVDAQLERGLQEPQDHPEGGLTAFGELLTSRPAWDIKRTMSLNGTSIEKIILAEPRGFCAGVDRAVEAVRSALRAYGRPLYVRHQIVHNRFVLEGLEAEGAVFVENLDDVPEGQRVIFSAHGVAKAVREEADRRGLRVFDATCPLVTKVHVEVAKMAREGREIVMIGHRGHPEVEGTTGQPRSGLPLVENVADVAGRIRDGTRLLTLTGPGGSGKTRLAPEAAAELVPSFRAGVFWGGPPPPPSGPSLPVPEGLPLTAVPPDACRE